MATMKQLLFGGAGGRGPGVSLGLLLLRLALGLSMALAHGLGKVPPPQGFVDGVANLGFPAPLVFAWAAGLAELAGGILLAAGLLTRPAALFLLVTMLVAYFGAHAEDPFGQKEMAYVYGAAFLAILLAGPGRISLDRILGRVRSS